MRRADATTTIFTISFFTVIVLSTSSSLGALLVLPPCNIFCLRLVNDLTNDLIIALAAAYSFTELLELLALRTLLVFYKPRSNHGLKNYHAMSYLPHPYVINHRMTLSELGLETNNAINKTGIICQCLVTSPTALYSCSAPNDSTIV